MSRTPALAALLVTLWTAACAGAPGPAAGAPGSPSARPSLPARPPPGVRLRPAAEAILSDQVFGAPRRGGHDHLTAAQAASEQPDQAAALAQFASWGWLDGSSRTWSTGDEVLVITARADDAARALEFWARDAQGHCTDAALAGLDDCRLGITGDRAVVVGRLGPAVFRLQCPARSAEPLAMAQAASLHA